MAGKTCAPDAVSELAISHLGCCVMCHSGRSRAVERFAGVVPQRGDHAKRVDMAQKKRGRKRRR